LVLFSFFFGRFFGVDFWVDFTTKWKSRLFFEKLVQQAKIYTGRREGRVLAWAW
jgi:hypothetical protein